MARRRRRAEAIAPIEALPALPEDAEDVESYYRSRKRKETALADLRQLEVLRRAGELIPVQQVTATWTRLVQRTRSALLAVPSRVRGACPGVDEQVVRVIDEEVRRALTMLADDWRDSD